MAKEKKSYPIHQKYIKSFDGTKIGYQVVGEGPIPFVLCNGLGGNILAWAPIFNFFGDQFTFLTWDYRGIFSSDEPKDLKNLTIDHHIKDLEIILKKEKITQAVFGGWSMGVQVCLEFYKAHAKMYRGIFLINGTYGSPFDTALNFPIGKYLFPKVNNIAKKFLPGLQPHIQPFALKIVDTESFIKIMKQLGMIHENFDSETFRQVASAMLNTNFGFFHEIMSHLGKHSSRDLLPKIKTPTLIVAGSRDILTPVKVAEKMAHLIPNAELFVLAQGTHYCILEFPDIINKRLRQFLKEHKLGDAT